MLSEISQSLKACFEGKLVDELLGAYVDAKRNFYYGGLRLSAVEGGRFCEAAFRMLEQQTGSTFTPIGKQLDIDSLIRRLANLSCQQAPDSVRIHIPRALRFIYDIRNKRDAAHLADDIDPNLQDATLVAANLDWVLAEFLRLHHSVSADEAQRIIGVMVSRKAPVVQEFGSFIKILNQNLTVSEQIMVCLYQRAPAEATKSEISSWLHPRMRANLSRTLHRMIYDQALIHCDSKRYFLTDRGKIEVERSALFLPN